MKPISLREWVLLQAYQTSAEVLQWLLEWLPVDPAVVFERVTNSKDPDARKRGCDVKWSETGFRCGSTSEDPADHACVLIRWCYVLYV